MFPRGSQARVPAAGPPPSRRQPPGEEAGDEVADLWDWPDPVPSLLPLRRSDIVRAARTGPVGTGLIPPGQPSGRRHAAGDMSFPTQQSATPAHANEAAAISNGRSAVPANGHLCGLFAVDIAGFSGPCRDDEIPMYVHKALYEMLEEAFDKSEIPWLDCAHGDRGDVSIHGEG
jgi:hypothetical protein